MSEDTHLFYKRSKFRTKLPRNRKYLKSHFWVRDDGEAMTVGFTKFSVRMLGEMVESDYEVQVGEKVEIGEVIGWIEGFKATSDIYAVVEGEFKGGNPDLVKDPELFFKKPYEAGWLYQVAGVMPEEVMDVEGYVAYLDETIERMEGAES